ncbi:MAG TPA: hypothetical protein VLS89_12045 [Candidatus Nanopelagicales bacterium]|nr:hypothetical protein [Candidatus Nanopelagicales bacterium]
MDRQTAEQVVTIASKCSEMADSSIITASTGASHEELHAYKRYIGLIMAAIFEGIMAPIYAEHPDLAPEWYQEMDRAAVERAREASGKP